MKKVLASLLILLVSSSAMALGLGNVMRYTNDTSGCYVYNPETKRYEPSPGYVPPGVSYVSEEEANEITSIRRELNGDIAIKRRGSGIVEEVWSETSSGHWERKY